MIKVMDVSKSYGHTSVLSNVSFEVPERSVTVIVGPSGAGKSSMLRCINRLETIQGGEITIGGQVVGGTRRQIRELRKHVGMVFQSFNLFPHMTAVQNIALAPVLALGRKKPLSIEIAEGLLAKVGLADKRDMYPGQLSGGQQQRVAIARALAMEPRVMLFDEPTSALDPELVGEVQAVIAQLAAEGMTMVIVTHSMSFARSIADEVIVMADGGIVESGPPEQIFSAPSHERTRLFLKSLLDGQ